MLLFATILTVGALAIFANSSGNLARIRDDGFDAHMRWANLLLEFGGLYPLVIAITAVSLSLDSDSLTASIVVGSLTSALLLAYEYSPFSILSRYHQPWFLHLVVIVTCALPAAFAPSVLVLGDETPWVAAVGLVLLARFFLHLRDRRAESRRRRLIPSLYARTVVGSDVR